MLKVLAISLIIMSSGCAPLRSIGNNEAYVITPEKKKYTVGLGPESKVMFKDANVELEVDNTGGEGLLEKVLAVKAITD